MDIDQLRDLIDRPEVHRVVLRGYRGPFSLGIGKDSANRLTLILQVPAASRENFPARIQLDGESIPVVVERGFVAPGPLAHRL